MEFIDKSVTVSCDYQVINFRDGSQAIEAYGNSTSSEVTILDDGFNYNCGDIFPMDIDGKRYEFFIESIEHNNFGCLPAINLTMIKVR